MSFVSSTFSRVSSVLSRNVFLSNMRRNNEDLLQVQEQLSTGRRILRLSDDPVGAHRVLDFNLRISRDTQYLRNLEGGISRLTVSDGTTENSNEILNRAREILLQQVQSTATAQSQAAAADEISALLEETLNLGNTKFQGRHIFGGSRTSNPPFVFVGGAVAFLGNSAAFNTDVADGLRLSTNIDPDKAFGVFSDDLRGLDLNAGANFLQPIDLDPRVSVATRLSSLNEGAGVRAGSLKITGTGSAIIDLANSENIGDVIDQINAQQATTGVTAAINTAQNGLELTSAAAITVEEVGGGLAAADLGIKATGATSPVVGTDLDPNVTNETLVGDLLGGAGIDSTGMVVSNVTATTSFSATFDAGTFGATATLGEVLDRINTAGLFVDARISDTGTGIDVLSRLSGGRLTISENGGTTASEMGLLSTLARADLEDLNDGLGLGSVEGADIRVTKKNGVDFFVDVDGATSVQSLVDLIDADPELTAALLTSSAGSFISVTDSSGGTGSLTIDNFNGSFAATNLGLAQTVPGSQVTGLPLTFAGVQPVGIFTALVGLRDALLAGDTVAINAAAKLVDESQKNMLEARAESGARLSSFDLTKNRLITEKMELEKLVSSTRDVDFAEAATRFQVQQTVLEASMAVASRILQTSILSYL